MARNKTTIGTAKRKNTKKHEDESEHINESDFDEDPLPDDVRGNIRQFGKEMMKLAVDQLRDEFKQIAIEGGRYGAQLALNGEDMVELQHDLENKERKLLKLRMEKKKLENDLYSQKEKNEELELLVAQKERQIKILENEVKNINKIMNKQKKDLEKEQASRKMKEDELLLNIKDLNGKCDKLKVQLQVKQSAGNVTKTEMQKLREKIAELEEGKLKERKDKKS